MMYTVNSADEMVTLAYHIINKSAMHISLEEAKRLKPGDIIYHRSMQNADGTSQRWKVNGKPHTWKTFPERVQIPLKRGLYDCWYLTHDNLNQFSLKDWRE